MGSIVPEDNLTRLAARHLHKIAKADLSTQVKEKAILCLLDYIGTSLSGLSTPWAPALLSFADSRRGAAESYLWGRSKNVAAETAAFTNAAISHSNIRDDQHLSSGSHIGVMVIPAALALAQRDKWTGAQLMRAIVAGYEMAALLGAAVRHNGRVNPAFRPSGIIGAFGAASAAIAATDLDEDIAIHALGFAANMAGGFMQWAVDGGMEIYVHAGTQSSGGLASFDLARSGMRCGPRVLEGMFGYFQAFAPGSEGMDVFQSVLEKADREFGAEIMAVHFKPVPGCNLTQAPVAIALNLREKIAGREKDIQEVTITTNSLGRDFPGVNSTGPFQAIEQTKQSIQFGVASALLSGRVDTDTFLQFENGELQDLTAKCTVEAIPDYDRALNKGLQPAHITIRLTDNTILRSSVPDVPWIQKEAVIARLKTEAAPILEDGVVDEILRLSNMLWDLEDCSPLFKAFSVAAIK